jgi:hypothetical protein
MTPEGKVKKPCRDLAKKLGLLFANVEGKSYNGWPDSECGKYPKGSGIIHIEFKVPGKEPTEQQWKRIREIREAGGEADWADSLERYCELIGYDLSL